MIRFISALFFAITLMVIAFGGMWYYAAQQATMRLKDVVQTSLSSELKFDEVRYKYELNGVSLVLKKVVMVSEAVGDGARFVYALPEVSFKSDYFGKYKVELELPQKQVMYVVRNGSSQVLYIMMEKGRAVYYPQQDQFLFSFLNARVHDGSRLIALTGIGDALINMRAVGGRREVKLLLKNYRPEGKDELFDTLVVNIGTKNFPPLTDMLIPLIGPKAYAPQEIAKRMAPYIHRQDAELDLDDVILRLSDGGHYALKGKLALDNRLRLEGEVRLSTGKPEDFKAFLEKTELLGPHGVENMELAMLLKKKQTPPYRYHLTFNRGEVMANSRPIGVLSPIEDMLH